MSKKSLRLRHTLCGGSGGGAEHTSTCIYVANEIPKSSLVDSRRGCETNGKAMITRRIDCSLPKKSRAPISQIFPTMFPSFSSQATFFALAALAALATGRSLTRNIDFEVAILRLRENLVENVDFEATHCQNWRKSRTKCSF